MDTLAWLMVLTAILIVRGVKNGRVVELPGDIRDTVVAMLTGDVEGLKEVGGRRGESASAVNVTLDTVPYGQGTGNLVTEMKRLAKEGGDTYKWGGESLAEGGYDCSGLVWAALKSLGIYSGPRFTASSFPGIAGKFAVKISKEDAQAGDIVRWPNHMGVVTGTDRYYSALNPKAGIKEDAIHNHRGTPTYWRVTGVGYMGGSTTGSSAKWSNKVV
jgi:cell wall-associated NlpC family hydrolase